MNDNQLNQENQGAQTNQGVQPFGMQNEQPQQPVEGQNPPQPELNQMNQDAAKKQAFEKSQKYLKIDFLIVGIIYAVLTTITAISLITSIGGLGILEGYGEYGALVGTVVVGAIFSVVKMIAITVFIFIGYSSAKQGKKAAGIIGMVLGVLMALSILSGDLIDFVIGVAFIINANDYLKNFKENNVAL